MGEVAFNAALGTSLSLSMLLSSLGTSIANVALLTLAQVFSASFHQPWVDVILLVDAPRELGSISRHTSSPTNLRWCKRPIDLQIPS